MYRRDPSSPGLVLSYLEETGSFYVSAVRYDGRLGTDKKVMDCATGETLPAALASVAASIAGTVTEIQKVDQMIKEIKRVA